MFFEKEGFRFESIPDIDGLPAIQGVSPNGSKSATLLLIGYPTGITRASLTVDVLENEPEHVADLMRSLLKLTVVEDLQDALEWLPNGMIKAIDEGKSEYTANNVQIVVEFKGSAYILTVSPSPETASVSNANTPPLASG